MSIGRYIVFEKAFAFVLRALFADEATLAGFEIEEIQIDVFGAGSERSRAFERALHDGGSVPGWPRTAVEAEDGQHRRVELSVSGQNRELKEIGHIIVV
jgi:hypothetical protein